MKQMNGEELRRSFLEFFAGQDHMVLPSAPLVPRDDPSLLWINAGMTPLKPYFEGRKKPPYPRVVTAQKCIRTNDIENVGKTARHLTFFEMMGNFSFADYFKEEAILWAWEFVTSVLDINPEHLWVTVYHDDEEAARIWKEKAGVPGERIGYLGKEDNFWEIGEGPCGPCSEIYFDRGEESSCGSGCTVGCACDRFNEIWNLVFTQFYRTSTGEYEPLPDKNIDTGMGLERTLAVLQGAASNYETDLFSPYIRKLEEISGYRYAESRGQLLMAFRVVADHVRALAFTLGDGVLPANEGRGYVIRRVLRRASRFGRLLGLDKPFLHRLVPVVVDVMGGSYPELKERRDYITQIVRLEEERFLLTINQGLDMLAEAVDALKQAGQKTLSGEKAFQLYDTYGFPLDLTRDVLTEEDLQVDEEGFRTSMQKQRERARKDRAASQLGWGSEGGKNLDKLVKEIGSTRFMGYEKVMDRGRIVALLTADGPAEFLEPGEQGIIILDSTTFYPEGGGQVGDTGIMRGVDTEVLVENTHHHEELILHEVKVASGTVTPGTVLELQVDKERRRAIARNHTATHLLHQALRQVIGDHVQQAGSFVNNEYLRFDFTHFQGLTEEERERVEEEVNRQILANHKVEPHYTSMEEARSMGALALFEEKYGKQVRVVRIGDYSCELCGGTHVEYTGETGLLKITSAGGIAAGVRRIEAVTGWNTIRHFRAKETLLKTVADLLKTDTLDVHRRIEALLAEREDLNRRLRRAQTLSLADHARELMEKKESIDGFNLVRAQVDTETAEELRALGDRVKERLVSGVIVLAAKANDKALFLVMVTPDLTEKGLHAGKIAGRLARFVGGGGGGRPDMAQAGGPQAEKLEQALAQVPDILKDA